MFSSLVLTVSLFISSNTTGMTNGADLIHEVRQLSFSAPQMSFRHFLENYQPKNEELVSWLKIQLASRDLVAKSLSSSCDYRIASHINFIAKLAIEREALLGKSSGDLEYIDSFHSLENGSNLYQHWLRSWLLSDISLEQLNQIAIQELIKTAKRRRQIVERKTTELGDTRILGKKHQKIVDRFRQKEARVIDNLDKYFPKLTPLDKVEIVPSTLPKSFPAPGIYDAVNQRFIYHLQDEYFYTHTMDWLYLHEGNPGHHYQSQFVKQQAQCADLPDRLHTSAFSEGWAAYVETLGKSLGLYTDINSELYALDWQALRAVRVILDIGIHAYGWDNKKATSVWMQHIPNQKGIMDREINRIRDWPGQVITYVYGKSAIEKYIEQSMTSGDLTLLDVHREILALSSYSVSLLKRN